jgi:hypothetical protein
MHDELMHIPAMHILLAGHVAQNAPPTPHAVFDVPGWHASDVESTQPGHAAGTQ